jgi:hypothetical protein
MVLWWVRVHLWLSTTETDLANGPTFFRIFPCLQLTATPFFIKPFDENLKKKKNRTLVCTSAGWLLIFLHNHQVGFFGGAINK